MIRSARLAVAVLATTLLAMTVLVAPAHADPERLRLGLSASGPFTDNLAAPLFSGSYVPGSARSTFYVKNDSTQTARATISVVPKSSYNAFERAISFAASVGGTSGTPVPYREDAKKNACRTLVTGPTVAGGGVQKIDVFMLIDENFAQPAIPQSATFSFVVTLSQVTPKGKVDVCGTQSPGGQSVTVAGTQMTTVAAVAPHQPTAVSRSVGAITAVSFAFVAAGAGLWLAWRRRREDEPDPA